MAIPSIRYEKGKEQISFFTSPPLDETVGLDSLTIRGPGYGGGVDTISPEIRTEGPESVLTFNNRDFTGQSPNNYGQQVFRAIVGL